MKKALIDSNGLLLAHGFVEFDPQPGETVIDVPDEFGLQPGKWRFQKGAEEWTGAAPPPSPRQNDLANALAKINAAINSPNVSKEVKDAFAAIKLVLQ